MSDTPSQWKSPDGEIYTEVEVETLTAKQLMRAVLDCTDYEHVAQGLTGDLVLIKHKDIDYPPYDPNDEEDEEEDAA
jgi:hypothetical protein